MARKIRIPLSDIVVTQQASVDLGDANGKVAINSCRVPGDGARLLDAKITTTTAGDTNANHLVTVERVSGNTDLSGVMTLDCDGTAETTSASADGLSSQPVLSMGEAIQLDNVESAAISNGAVVHVVLRWIL